MRMRVHRRRFLGLSAALAAAGMLPGPWQRSARAQAGNPIIAENAKPGNPDTEWDVDGTGDPTIQGFATEISVNRGETVYFKVNTTARAYRLDIYRMGYYGGMGARKVATVQPSASLPQSQPSPLSDAATGLVDCGNWAVSASWVVPADAVSGIYFARAVRTDTGGASHIIFVVRDDASTSPLLFQTSDTTWQAYNSYGGNSLYTGSPAGRAYKVSYNRPFNNRANGGGPRESWVFNAEYPMVRWLEANGYNLSYFTGVDSDRRGALIKNHKAFLSVGHDEYWSAAQRANVEAARNTGVHLAFFSGNECFWKTRWENSIDASGVPYRTLVCYKETLAGAKIDPNPAWTGTWRDPRFSPPADGGRPENTLTGTIFMVNGPRGDAITVPAADGKMRFWRNTSVATLPNGQTATMPDGTLGYEWDEDRDNGSRPPGLVRLSTTTLDVTSYLLDYGGTYGLGTATHRLTLYRHSSGALVFGAGTVQWSWGLDANHDNGGNLPDVRMQQATVNLLADMGAQPGTLQPGLVPASASTDSTRPTSTITSPANGATVTMGSAVTISGTAADVGGVVGGVEVSVDGGTTWHPATGRGTWSYSWTPSAPGSATIKSRAVDDSGNLETPGVGITVTIAPRAFPLSIWSNSPTPAVPSSGDAQAIEVGVKFRADVDGYITGIRFYKGSGNTGTHVGHLWTAAGTLLATATFTGETATGWQQASFPAPVVINANVTYVASCYMPNGNYAKDANYFATAYDNYPLHALADGASGGNGVYKYGASGLPTQSFSATNYWVDVVMDNTPNDTIPPTVSSQTPAPNTTGVNPTTTVTATFSEAVQAATISFVLKDAQNVTVPAAVTYDGPSRTATLTPSSQLAQSTTYTATVSGAKDLAGNPMAAPVSWSFTTTGPAPSIWSPSVTPAVTAQNDPQPVEVGVKLRSDIAGYITGIRFYKGSTNTGTHVGHLWSATGTLLASATFAGETASGWQQASFPAPVAIAANATYVASYHTDVGNYALNSGYFATTGVDNYPLHALANGVDGGNGVYQYGASAFPTNSFNAGNYWVDVVFSTTYVDMVAPTVTARTPAPNATGVAPTSAATATFSEPVQAGTISFVLKDQSNAAVPAAVVYDAATQRATLTPTAQLALGSTYTATVSGAKDVAGNAMSAPVTWSFSTTAMPATIWPNAATPATASSGDPNAVEVGVKFTTDIAGYITGIRFYKGSTNTGTHVGHLWSATGTLLASATFAGETASGWQQASFPAPVAIAANATYVASYYAPNGGYAVDRDYFATAATDSWPLHALASPVSGGNGVYLYGSGGGFPTNSYQATNYWVDVVFDTNPADTVAPAVTARTPAPNATGVAVGTTVTATFSEPVTPSSISFVLKNASNAVVPSTVTYDGPSRTATLTPNAQLGPNATYAVTLSGAADAAGNAMTSTTWSFTTATLAPNIWSPSVMPAVTAQNDPQPVEVGVKLRSDIAGYITGIRFYKGSTNTGTHVGHLWSATGTLLASATFAGETASGWQQASFPAPVAIAANATYVASYHTDVGNYALNSGYFATTGVDNYPLHALANGVDGGNGVYQYGASAFPTNSFNAGNYWVDVVFSATAS